jgi:isopenicillin N synthase-like dioxygenase
VRYFSASRKARKTRSGGQLTIAGVITTTNRQDWKQILDRGPDAETGPLAGARTQWPALAGFESTFMALTAELHRVALAVTETITASLGAQLPTQEAFEEYSSFLRINYYPLIDDASAGSKLDRSFGIHPHTDAGAVTVLCQDEVASLQVHRGGQWETITKPKDALIINIGDIVQAWSNDRFTAPVHRILARSDRTRQHPLLFKPLLQLRTVSARRS